MKVKEFENWNKLVFSDRTILKCDLKYMSSEQRNFLNELEVIKSCSRGKVLYIDET